MYPTCDTLARSVLPAQQEPGSAFRMESCSGLPEDRFFRGGVPHFGTAFVRSINVTVSGPRRGGRVAAPPPAEGRSGATAVRTIFPGSRTPSCTGCLNRDSDGRETPLRCPHGRPLRPFLRALRRSYGRRCGHPERGARPASPYSCSSLRRRRAPAVTEIVSGRLPHRGQDVRFLLPACHGLDHLSENSESTAARDSPRSGPRPERPLPALRRAVHFLPRTRFQVRCASLVCIMVVIIWTVNGVRWRRHPFCGHRALADGWVAGGHDPHL